MGAATTASTAFGIFKNVLHVAGEGRLPEAVEVPRALQTTTFQRSQKRVSALVSVGPGAQCGDNSIWQVFLTSQDKKWA